MRLNGIAAGDVVRVNRLGRVFLAEVTGTIPGGLQIVPADKRVSYRQCRAREVLDHWAKRGRPTLSDEAMEPSPRQMELGF
ncbi:MAG: hypothetical protein ACXVFK_15695 [Solirubrobacteraceae bacterium]